MRAALRVSGSPRFHHRNEERLNFHQKSCQVVTNLLDDNGEKCLAGYFRFTRLCLCKLLGFAATPLKPEDFLTVRVISHGPISLKIVVVVVVLGDILLKFQYIMNNSTIL